MKDEEFTEEGEIYKEAFESNDGRNVIKIAGRRPEVYIETILKKLQKYDQIIISCLDTYLDIATYIIRLWEAVGVYPEKNEYNPKQKLFFIKKMEEISNRETGKKYKKPVNIITLTKDPNIYRFTKI